MHPFLSRMICETSPLITRCGSDGYFPDSRAGDADVRGPQGTAESSPPHVRPHHGRHEPQRGGEQTGARHQHPRRDTGPSAGPPTGNNNNQFNFYVAQFPFEFNALHIKRQSN